MTENKCTSTVRTVRTVPCHQCDRLVSEEEAIPARAHYRPASWSSPAEWDDVLVCPSCVDSGGAEPPWDTIS
jgi:hypothetical protein